jgi:SAM-dependent methyltransferase
VFRRDGARRVCGAVVDDDDLERSGAFLRGEGVERSGERGGRVAGGDDDARSDARHWAANLPIRFRAMPSDAGHMQRFWDARAKENAKYYVDNRLDYNHADDKWFWDQGEKDLDTLLEAVGASLAAEDRVLDIGCGVGRLTRVAAARAAHATGIDISAEMVDQAKVNLAGVDNVALVVGDGTSLRPLPDAAFSAVISLVVFQHIPDPQVTLGYVREIGRVLQPGGWAAFQVSNDPDVHARDYPKPSLLQRLVGRAPKGQDDPAWRGSAVALEDLRAAAADGGMDLEQVVGEGTQYCLVRARRHI